MPLSPSGSGQRRHRAFFCWPQTWRVGSTSLLGANHRDEAAQTTEFLRIAELYQIRKAKGKQILAKAVARREKSRYRPLRAAAGRGAPGGAAAAGGRGRRLWLRAEPPLRAATARGVVVHAGDGGAADDEAADGALPAADEAAVEQTLRRLRAALAAPARPSSTVTPERARPPPPPSAQGAQPLALHAEANQARQQPVQEGDVRQDAQRQGARNGLPPSSAVATALF